MIKESKRDITLCCEECGEFALTKKFISILNNKWKVKKMNG